MNDNRETFRRITMKVLTMQLNPVTIMDLIAYGGAAAAGIIVAVTQFGGGSCGLRAVALPSSSWLPISFIPSMRQLGKVFHIAMERHGGVG